MTALTEAEAALEAARERSAEAQRALSAARTRLASLREQATTGDVAPGELTAARDALERAELAVGGPEQEVARLHEAFLVAQSDAEADRISSTLRTLGGDAARALDRVEQALDEFAVAAARFDAFVRSERPHIATRCARTDRVVVHRHTHPTVDAIRMVESDAMAQLAALLLPVARVVGAEAGLVEDLRTMGRSAPILPRDDR